MTSQEGCFLNIYFCISVKGGIAFTCVFFHSNVWDYFLIFFFNFPFSSVVEEISGLERELFSTLLSVRQIFFSELMFVVLDPSLSYLVAYSTERNKL